MNKEMKKGFTLVEMLIVIGIMSILAAASVIGYSKIIKSARRTKNQELVANVATALTHILSKEGVWPQELIDGAKNGDGKLDKEAAKAFIRHRMLGLAYNIRTGTEGNYTLVGKDRCGIVDAEAEAVLKRNKGAKESTKVPSGGTVDDHILRYAIDTDGDGITETQSFGNIRASAVVWSSGPDGKVEYQFRGRNDDVYSWRAAQVVK